MHLQPNQSLTTAHRKTISMAVPRISAIIQSMITVSYQPIMIFTACRRFGLPENRHGYRAPWTDSVPTRVQCLYGEYGGNICGSGGNAATAGCDCFTVKFIPNRANRRSVGGSAKNSSAWIGVKDSGNGGRRFTDSAGREACPAAIFSGN